MRIILKTRDFSNLAKKSVLDYTDEETMLQVIGIPRKYAPQEIFDKMRSTDNDEKVQLFLDLADAANDKRFMLAIERQLGDSLNKLFNE